MDDAAWHGLPSGIDSGDIVLFNRRCMSMSMAGAVLCYCAKLFQGAAWDHVGIVVRNPENGELMFLEADFGGVKLRSLAERVRRSQSHEIAVRKLSIVRTDEMRQELYDFACEMRDRPYGMGSGWVASRLSNQAIKQERLYYHAKYNEKQSRLKEIDLDLKNAVLPPAARNYLLTERRRAAKEVEEVKWNIERLQRDAQKSLGIEPAQMENASSSGISLMGDDSLAGGAMPSAANYGEFSKDLSRVFCSELVAVAYQRLGLLDSTYPPAESYYPASFSTDSTDNLLEFRKGASLADEIFLRISQKRVKQNDELQKSGNGNGKSNLSVYKNSKELHGIGTGDQPNSESRKLIKEALKRSPVDQTITDEMKRVAFNKSFKAVVMEAGEVVFEQGEYGKDMYIIEEGKVDRFVRKGNEEPMHTNSLGPRSCFGTTGFVFTTPRSATIRARERTLLWKVDRETYEAFKDDNLNPGNKLSDADQRMLRRILANHFLFSRLDRIGPREVNAFYKVGFRAGEEIFGQGQDGDNFYIIKSGEVERHIRHPKEALTKEDEVTLAKTLRSGQSFGELSLMYDAKRGATSRARTDVELFAIDKEQYHKLNLGRGTEFLRTRFNKSASITRDGEKYMTTEDFLTKIANADGFPEKDRSRLSWLLASLVSNNRQRDPMRSRESRRQLDDKEVLLNFWDFARLDIVLNDPLAEQNLLFLLADQDNTGFISFEEMQRLLMVYEDKDETARQMLEGKMSTLRQAFGDDGSRILSAEQFNALSKKILPRQFVQDVGDIARHMRNVHIKVLVDEELRFVEDQSPSMVGSNFVSAPKAGDAERNAAAKKRDTTLSSVVASALSRTAVAPLERLKILMQADTSGKYRGLVSGLRTMVKEDSSTGKALFRGNAVNMVRIVPTVLVTGAVTEWLSKAHAQRGAESRRVREFKTLCVGGVAGIVSTALIYPLEFARGRLSVQNAAFQPHAGYMAALRSSIKRDGIASIYRGVTPSIIGTFAYSGLPYVMFEGVRHVLPKRDDGSSMPTAPAAIVSATVVSLITQSVAFPLDTVRRRMQVAGFGNDEPVRRFGATVRSIYRREGMRAFFRGILPNTLKVAPYTTVMYFAMEYSRNAYTNGVNQWKR